MAETTGSVTIDVADEAGTAAVAAALALLLRAGDVIALAGPLGAGKTAFARSLLRTLAGNAGLEVPSPTFTLVQPYDLEGLTVHHLDLYRLGSANELDELGFDEAVAAGAVLVEWPERAGARLPADALTITLAAGAKLEARRLTLAGAGDWPNRLEALKIGP